MTDQEILDAKAQVGAGGLGCEPASAASVAGAKLLRSEGIIGADERVLGVITGSGLKDTVSAMKAAGEPIKIEASLDQVAAALSM